MSDRRGRDVGVDYRALFESVPGLYLVLAPDAPRYTIVAVSDAYLRATLTRREQILERGLFEIFPDDPADPAATGVRNLSESLARVLSKRVADTMALQKYPIRRPPEEGGGFEDRWWSPVNTPVLAADGSVAYIIHRVEDVTEVVRMRQARQEHLHEHAALQDRANKMEAQMRAFIRHAPMSIAMFDRGMNYLAVSARWEKEYGLGPGSLAGRNHYEVFPDLPARWKAVHRQALAGVTLKNDEEEWVRSDGKSQWLRWAALPWYDENGAIGGIILSTEDVTYRKHTEDKLRESQQRYSALFEKSPFAVALLTLPRFDLTDANDAFERLFGYGRAELCGKTALELKLLDADFAARASDELFRLGTVPEFECPRVNRAGEERIVSINLVRIELGEKSYALMTSRDLTEYRRAQDTARLYEKTKALDELKTRFFAGVSHELRTPLALILGPVQRLLADAPMPRPARHDLELIERNAQTLLHYVNDLLDVAKLDAARVKAEYAQTDVTRLLRFIASHFESLAAEKQLTYTLEVPEGLSAQLDPEKVGHVLLNLLSNAFKFTPALGTVRLSVGCASGRLRIEVADSGPGIPPEHREVVFERFHQLEGGAARRSGGSGLGLSIARDFVELHGGALTVSSAPESGALFVVELPMQAPAGAAVRPTDDARSVGLDAAKVSLAGLRAESARPPAPLAIGPEAGGLVLVAEDNAEMNRFICENLLPEHRVVSARDGRQALDLALSLHPDVIVTDMMMPELNGEELVRAVRAHRELARTPILFLTARADADFRVRCLRAGVQDYLTKPFSVDELRARVANLILGRRVLLAQTRLAALVRQAPDGIFLSDPSGRYIEINDAGCRMFACSRAELLGKRASELVLPEERERLSAIEAQMGSQGMALFDWTLRTKDGSLLPVEVSSKLLPDGSRQSILRDLSERRRLEQALRFSEALSSGVLSLSPDAIITVDESQRITRFNESAKKIFGYEADEALGAPLALLIPERLRESHRQHVERFGAGKPIARRMGQRSSVIIGRRKNGEEFPADAAIARIEIGGKTLMTVTLRDITEQKRHEHAQDFLAEVGVVLARTLDYEETVARVAELAVREFADFCMVNFVEDGEVRRLKAISRDPAKAELCAALLRIPVAGTRLEVVKSAWESGHPVTLPTISAETVASWAQSAEELEVLRKLDMKTVIIVPLLAHGKPVGSLTLVVSGQTRVYETHELRLLEELALRASLALENARLYRTAIRALQARDDVLNIVAHDLRNPLNAITLQAQVALRKAASSGGAGQNPILSIQRAAQRMNRLIQDLLDVARLEAGALSIEIAYVHPEQLISESVEAQRPLLEKDSLALRLEIAPQLPKVWADRGRMQQIFENLLGNAIKFSEPGGCITVGARQQSQEVLFWVSDTGVGISAEQMPHLFDRYWQATRTDRRGVGLGLPIVKGLVTAHGGRIWVESTLGQGATFYFTLPAAPHPES